MEDLPVELNRSIIIIDKPAGPTSFQVTDFVREQLGLNKASHFGTLDPAVSGVLPIALGRAARLTGYFSKQDKEYVGIMHIHEDIKQEKIEKIIKSKFLGKIKQLPPVKSRVKRELREREIKTFEILETQNKDILFRVECEAGTYIRKLIHDLGEELKIGAHMLELRRTRAAIFKERDAVNLYEFQKAVSEYRRGKQEKMKSMLIPIEIITKIMPQIKIKEEAVERIKHGSPIFREMIKQAGRFNKSDFIAVLYNKKLVEIAQAEISSRDIKGKGEQGITARPKTVLN